MNIQIVPAPGVGDALIFHLAAYHLQKEGHKVFLDTPHGFGSWLPSYPSFKDPDAFFLQHDNSPKAKKLLTLPLPVYTFYGSHNLKKHGPLRFGLDFVANPEKPMALNLLDALKTLFHITPSLRIGLAPPKHLIYQRYPKRIAIQKISSNPDKDFGRFDSIFQNLKSLGLNPIFLPHFPTLSELFAFIYESGFVLSNDSAPGHIASLLQVPHIVIASNARHMRLWRPSFGPTQIVTPSLPNWKIFRPYWRNFIKIKSIMKLITKNYNIQL